jgi:hypothetical protein
MISPERDLKSYLHTANGSDRGFALKAAQSPRKRADFARESPIAPRESYIGTARGVIGDRKRSLFQWRISQKFNLNQSSFVFIRLLTIRRPFSVSPKDAFCSVIAAATEYNHNSQNNDPGAVVVEEMAQAVVVHICFPPNVTLRVFSLA